MESTTPYPLTGPIVVIAASTLLYLLLDMYLLSKRFREIFLTAAFYLLWLVYTILAVIAYGAIRVSSMTKIQSYVEHPQLAQALLVILAVFTALTVVPSFSLKLSDFKVIDVGQLVDRFRAAVYGEITDRVLATRRSDGQLVASKLAQKFSGNAQQLRDELGTLYQLSGVAVADIKGRLDAASTLAKSTGLSEVRVLANSIVLQDSTRARALL